MNKKQINHSEEMLCCAKTISYQNFKSCFVVVSTVVLMKTIEDVDNLIIMLFCFITSVGLLQDNIHLEDLIKCYICIVNFVRT